MAVRLKRVTDPLDDRVKDRIVTYGSSGSEHSATASQTDDDASFHSLSYLLNCFNEENQKDDVDEQFDEINSHNNDSDSESEELDAKTEEIVSTLRDMNTDTFRNVLFVNVTKAINVFNCLKPNATVLNRNVMLYLQKLGYNAAITKTKWQTTGGLTAGSYEFIDVIESTTLVRYFIDVNFSGEFQIARPTNNFRRFITVLPVIFVGKSTELKRIVKLMSDEIRRSLKSRRLLIPPWRKNRFMQNKWFGPYRRTVNYTPVNVSSNLTVPVNQMTAGVKCSLIGFSVGDSAPLLNAATRIR
ncbi:uncharacterized protein LOC143556994 [Bidens hawaiensis]|uniref:uncharacterized protein LOC143556994 n=1 Tax=Bidens hawaiensis TaxID=980011 RepID=UPI00404A60C1